MIPHNYVMTHCVACINVNSRLAPFGPARIRIKSIAREGKAVRPPVM